MKKFFQLVRSLLSTSIIKLNQYGEWIKYGGKIRREMAINPQVELSTIQKREVKNFYSSFGFKNIRYSWHQYYGGIFGSFDKNFIPQDLFFSRIENSLNDLKYSNLQDKNLLSKLFSGIRQPKTYVKKVNGFYQKENLLLSKEEVIATLQNKSNLIIKPTVDTSGGKGVVKFSTEGLKTNIDGMTISQLLDSYKKDYIIQEALKQSEVMKALNSSSLNTIRIASYLRDSGPIILFAIVRFGSKGEYRDNISTGGYYCKILKNGKLEDQGFNTVKHAISVTDEGTTLRDFVVPNYDLIEEKVKLLHAQVPYFKLISWDIGIDQDDQPVLIEFNSHGQSIDFQGLNGPLFGKYTEEVLQNASQFTE